MTTPEIAPLLPWEVREGLLLTFAIPTYNRLADLRRLLESLAPQLQRINAGSARVEVLVCNNASTDGTAAFLDAFDAIATLRVVHHASNLGADANVIQCFARSRGRHVWIFGDDDMPLPGALEKVVSCLASDDPALVYLPAQWHSGDLTALAQRPLPDDEIRRVDAMTLAIQSNAFITFLSSWIVSRDAYARLAVPHDPARHANTSLPQLEWHFTLLAHGDRLMAARADWVMARSGNTGGYPVLEVFTTNFKRIAQDRLREREQLAAFFSEFMLRSYLPVLVWGLRQGALGAFEQVGAQGFRSLVRSTWPEPSAARWLLYQIGSSMRSVAFVAFAVSRITCRVWLAVRKAAHPTGGVQ